MKLRTPVPIVVVLVAVVVSSCGGPAVVAPPSAYRTPSEAIAAYERSLARDPTDARTHMWLGMTMLGEGRPEQAIPHLRQAIETDPSLTEAFLALGIQREKEGNYPEALSLYDAAIRGNPTLMELVQRRHALTVRREAALAKLDEAWALVTEGSPEEAIEILRPLRTELPSETRVFELIARAAIDMTKALLAYDARKTLLEEARAAAEVADRLGSANAGMLVATIDSIVAKDTEDMALAREKVEAGGATFTRDLCTEQKAPLLVVKNRRPYDLTLDLRFIGGVTQWVVTGDQASLRAAPSRDAARIAVLARGTTVWITRTGPDNFVNVVSSAGDGWVPRSVLTQSSFASYTVRAGSTLRVVLAPGEAEYRLGRGVKTLAEGREEFAPYLCYSWE